MYWPSFFSSLLFFFFLSAADNVNDSFVIKNEAENIPRCKEPSQWSPGWELFRYSLLSSFRCASFAFLQWWSVWWRAQLSLYQHGVDFCFMLTQGTYCTQVFHLPDDELSGNPLVTTEHSTAVKASQCLVVGYVKAKPHDMTNGLLS